MAVFVLNSDGKPLTPVSNAVASHLLDSGKVKVIRKHPFVIQYLVPQKESPEKEKIHPLFRIGIKPGGKVCGISLVMIRENVAFEIISGNIHLRTDIKNKLEERRNFRRMRRSRLWYRPARFNNRPKKKCKVCGGNTKEGQTICSACLKKAEKLFPKAPHLAFKDISEKPSWVPPTIENRITQIVNVVKLLKKYCPITPTNTEICVETSNFDIRKLIDPEIEGKEYQEGIRKGKQNLRLAIISLYDSTCQICGEKRSGLRCVHIKGNRNSVENLACVCEKCLKKKGSAPLDPATFKIPIRDFKFLKIASVVGVKEAERIVKSKTKIKQSTAFLSLIQSEKNALKEELGKVIWKEEGVPAQEVFGFETNYIMKKLGLSKSENGKRALFNDALAVALYMDFPLESENESEKNEPFFLSQEKIYWEILPQPRRKRRLFDANPVRLHPDGFFVQHCLVKNLPVRKIDSVVDFFGTKDGPKPKKDFLNELVKDKENVKSGFFTPSATQKIPFKRVLVKRKDIGKSNAVKLIRTSKSGEKVEQWYSQVETNEGVLVVKVKSEKGKERIITVPLPAKRYKKRTPEINGEVIKKFKKGDKVKDEENRIGIIKGISTSGQVLLEYLDNKERKTRSAKKLVLWEPAYSILFNPVPKK